jgi:putative proteasome-type protease
MTYCAGIRVSEGLVMIADTRTNAGLDDISIYRKLSVFEKPGERVLALATAGNLSVTQSALALVTEGLPNSETGEAETLMQAPSMFKAAQLVGAALRKITNEVKPSLEDAGINYNARILFGGQIKGEPLKLYMIYGEGNFIECSHDSPFLQIGEHKYGKPILDRAVTYETSIQDALKLGLISFDSTMRSNLAVGPPLDLVVLREDALALDLSCRIEPDEPYFHGLRESWSAALRAAHIAIPAPPYWENAKRAQPAPVRPPIKAV